MMIMNQDEYLSRNQICKQFQIDLLAFKKYWSYLDKILIEHAVFVENKKY